MKKLSTGQIIAIIAAVIIGLCYYRYRDVHSDEYLSTHPEPTPKDFSPPPEAQPASKTNYREKATFVSSTTPVPTQWDHSKFDKLSAYLQMEKFVKNKLLSPSTAEFSDNSDRSTTQKNDTTWYIDSFVDSQNGYGAMIRTRYTGTIVYHPITDSIVCRDLEFLTRY